LDDFSTSLHAAISLPANYFFDQTAANYTCIPSAPTVLFVPIPQRLLSSRRRIIALPFCNFQHKKLATAELHRYGQFFSNGCCRKGTKTQKCRVCATADKAAAKDMPYWKYRNLIN
jgi:hypothetical protein